MTGTADRNDYAAVIRRLEERVRVLETSTPAARTSISRGATTAGAAFLTSEGGGRVGSGTAFFRNDGALTDSDGTLNVAVNMLGAASGTFAGYVRGQLGVEAPLESGGPLVSLGPAVAEADRKGQSGYNNAMAARDEAADAKSAATTAQSGVNNLSPRMSAAEGDVSDAISYVNYHVPRLYNLLNAIEGRVASLEGKTGNPITPPGGVKG